MDDFNSHLKKKSLAAGESGKPQIKGFAIIGD
jgi:hypothetical protein